MSLQANIYFDIDKTLITEDFSFNINLDLVVNKIAETKKKGVLFHINSNRSLDTAMKYYSVFGFNGDVIFENGSGILERKTNEVVTNIDLFDYDLLLELIKSENQTPLFVDVETELNQYKIKSGRDLDVMFIEKTRKYSASLYLRKLHDGTFVAGDIRKIKYLMEKEFSHNYELKCNYVGGDLMLIHKNASKMNFLTKDKGIICCFGDSETDFDMFELADYFGCPENSSKETKHAVVNMGGEIMHNKYTFGSLEFINRVISRYL